MGQLTNLYVSQSYQGLLKMTDSTNGLTNTLQTVQTGDGDNSPLQMSLTEVNISGSLTVNGQPISVNTGSLVTTSSFNAYTSSVNTHLAGLDVETGSLQNQINGLATTGSLSGYTTLTTFNNYTSSNDIRVNDLISKTGSYVTETESGSFVTNVVGNLVIDENQFTVTKGDGTTSTVTINNVNNSVSSSYSFNAVTASIASDVIVYGKCDNPGGLTKGTIVRIVGASGNNPLFDSASWSDEASSANVLGMLSDNVTHNGFANIIVVGTVTGLNTNAYSPSTLLYLSSSGQYTSTVPTAPSQSVRLGQVLRQNVSNGSMYFRADNGYELDELHNVVISSPQQGNLLSYVSGSYGLWENKSNSQLGLATTGSNTFNGTQTITGSVNVTGNISATSASFQYVNTIYETASIIYSSGSNQLGDASNDTQTLYGTVNLPAGNLNVTGATTSSLGFYGNLQGTASYATNALSASYAPDSSNRNGLITTGSIAGTQSITGSLISSGSSTFIGNQTINGSVNINNPIATGNINLQVESGSFTKTAINLQAEKSFIQAQGDLYFFNTWDATSSGSINFQSPNQINFLATSSVSISGSNNVDIKSSKVSVTGSVDITTGPLNVVNTTGTRNVFSGAGNITQFQGKVEVTGSLEVTSSLSVLGNSSLFTITPSATKQNLNILTGKNPITSSTVLNNYLNAITTSLSDNDTNIAMIPGGALLSQPISNFTGSFNINGSNNLLLNLGSIIPSTQGRKAIVGSANIVLTNPSINTSSLTIPTINNNYNAGGMTLTLTTGSNVGNNAHQINANVNLGSITWNHPSASIGAGQSSNIINNVNVGNISSVTNGPTVLTTTGTLNGNIISNGGVTLNNYSSSISSTYNVIAGNGFTVNNRYYQTGSTNTLAVSANIVAGQTIVVNAAGSPSTNVSRTLVGNIIGGQTVNVSLEQNNTDTGGLRNSLIYGQGLNVTGSHSAASTAQNNITLLGRWNTEDSGLADSARTVFAVGTGTAAGSRRTGFYITSGSLVGVSGSFDVNGNSTFTGSVTVKGTTSLSGSNPLRVGTYNNEGVIQTLGGSQWLYRNTDTYNTVIGNAGGVNSGFFTGSEKNMVFNGFNTPFSTGSNNVIIQGGGDNFISGSNNIFIGGHNGQAGGSDNLLLGATSYSSGSLFDSKFELGTIATSRIFHKQGSDPLQIGDDTQVTGSISISNVMNLKPQNPLPSGVLGDLAVSSSAQLYFNNGSTWTLIV